MWLHLLALLGHLQINTVYMGVTDAENISYTKISMGRPKI
jgi:hypothetical protein